MPRWSPNNEARSNPLITLKCVLDHCLVPTTHILVCTHNHKSNLGQDLQNIRSKLGEYHRKKNRKGEDPL